MVGYINFIFSNLILDLVVIFSVKNFFRLSANNLLVVSTQVLNITTSFLYLYCGLTLFQFVLIKTGVNFVICLFIADDYKLRSIASMFGLHIVLTLSVYGFAQLMLMLVKISLEEFFNLKLSGIFNFLLIFCIFLYVFAIFLLMRTLSKQKLVKNYLAKVSFSYCCQHIEFVGLLDSGNSLTDKITGKPVIVVSTKSLKRYLPKADYEKIERGDFSPLKVSHVTNFVTAGEKTSYMPVADVGSVTVEVDGLPKKVECVLGFVNQNFSEEGGFDCLLHKDFI